MAINEIEEYLRKILEIPFVNLKGIDGEICNEILNVLKKAFYLYPALKKIICTIGEPVDIDNQINLLINSSKYAFENGFEAVGWKTIDDCIGDFETFQLTFKESSNINYIGISLKPILKEKTLDQANEICLKAAKTGFHPKHCTTFESSFWHELGHVLDSILKISEKQEFHKLIKYANIKEEISEYATFSSREILAEAFSEYYSTSEPSELIKNIVDLINLEYVLQLRKNPNIFDVAKKYRH